MKLIQYLWTALKDFLYEHFIYDNMCDSKSYLEEDDS